MSAGNSFEEAMVQGMSEIIERYVQKKIIKERISLSGDLKSKVKQLMIYAGWYEGRKVDISIASQYYAERGVPMMKSSGS